LDEAHGRLSLFHRFWCQASSKAAQDLRDEFNLAFDLEIYHPSQIGNEEIDVQAFSRSPEVADAVLIDLMGAGRRRHRHSPSPAQG